MSRNAKVAIFTLALAVVAVPALANSFEVRLHNGTVFETRYEPEPAPWDDSLVYFMTDTSNTMAIPAADVAEIVSTVEDSGMGTFLDDHTILIGLAPNDNLTPEELEALGDQAPQPQLPNYNVQQFAEPNATQGIPIWFTNQTTPPLGGGGGAFGGAAAERRGGGGGNFVEPNATNF